MNRYAKLNGQWIVTGNGQAPSIGDKVQVETRAGHVKTETVRTVIAAGKLGDGTPIWLAEPAPRPVADRPWKRYDEVGMHGEQ